MTLQAKFSALVVAVTDTLLATDGHLTEFIAHQDTNMVCKAVPSPLGTYWAYLGKLNLSHDGLLFVERIVAPATLQTQVLEQLYRGHQGVTKCRQLPKRSVWWPGLSVQVADMSVTVRLVQGTKYSVLNHLFPASCLTCPSRG